MVPKQCKYPGDRHMHVHLIVTNDRKRRCESPIKEKGLCRATPVTALSIKQLHIAQQTLRVLQELCINLAWHKERLPVRLVGMYGPLLTVQEGQQGKACAACASECNTHLHALPLLQSLCHCQ